MGNAGATCCASSTSTEKPEVTVATTTSPPPAEPAQAEPEKTELKTEIKEPKPKCVVLRFSLPDGGTQDIEFESKPLGIDFSRSLPLTCKRLKPGKLGEKKEVKIGWKVTHIDDAPVPMTFEETLKTLQQAVAVLPESS